MKTVLFGLAYIVSLVEVSAKATVCNASGSYCKEVITVFNGTLWETACCDNVSGFEGGSCEDDCMLAKNLPPEVGLNNVSINKENAYVKFSSGYRAWVIIDSKPLPNTKRRDIDVELIRTFLPSAREVFKNNKAIQKLEYAFDDNTQIVIQRPDDDQQLAEEIQFKDWSEVEEGISKKSASFIEEAVKVYPNPASDVVDIKVFKDRFVKKVQIMGANGSGYKDLENVTISENHAQVDVKGLASGSYFIRIEDNTGRSYIYILQVKRE